MATITKAVSYKPRLIFGSGVPGILEMNKENVVFVPDDPRSFADLNVGFENIKGYMFSKAETERAMLKLITHENGKHVFEFNDVADRDACCNFVAKSLGGRHEENARGENITLAASIASRLAI